MLLVAMAAAAWGRRSSIRLAAWFVIVRGSHGGEKAGRLVAPKILAEVTANHTPQSERQYSRTESTATDNATEMPQWPGPRAQTACSVSRTETGTNDCAALDETTPHASQSDKLATALHLARMLVCSVPLRRMHRTLFSKHLRQPEASPSRALDPLLLVVPTWSFPGLPLFISHACSVPPTEMPCNGVTDSSPAHWLY